MIDRESFNQLISGLAEIRTKYVDDGNASRKSVRSPLPFFLFFSPVHSRKKNKKNNSWFFYKRIHDAFAHVQLSDIRVIATLGVGGFGRVELVQIANDTSRSYGLKQMKKSQVLSSSN